VTAKVANVSFEAIVRAATPFLIPLFAVLAACTLWPPLTTWLPSVLLGR
jgi:TRAP-type C4-dicarboxylate transport system permease large subunit